MNHRAMEDHMMLMSQLYPGAYTQITPQQGETKPRRRRSRKNKGGENGAEGAIKKRKLSAEQVSLLEQNFGNEHKLHSEKKDRLALELGLDPRQVAVWFQNRRARWKNKKLEEEYSNLKNAHETTVTEKCHLETEVVRLKEQLLQAEKEIQWLLERAHRALSTVDPPFLGDFGVKGYDDVFYIPETPHINGMEWINLYCEPKENAGICR